ncbi:MAG: hypothetical protein HUK22_03905, partial [Thermoguttaceae bacterium]|nr:hypothetical protein [Thermoguttaceae bacterium]
MYPFRKIAAILVAVISIFSTTSRTFSAEGGLYAQASLTCNGVALGAILPYYAELYGFAYIVDRRVDPATPISGAHADEPLFDALRKILEDADLSACAFGDSFLWIGPADGAGRLLLTAALQREAREAGGTSALAQKLAAPIAFSHPDFAEPTEVFEALGKKAKIKLVGFEKTPFDRWRAVKLPPTPAAELLSIFLAGYDVDYRFDATKNEIKPVALDG